MHFCVLAARENGRLPVPRNTSLNWFMPAFVNKSVGSSCGTTGDDGTNVCPCFWTKKSMNCWRISLEVGMVQMADGFGKVASVAFGQVFGGLGHEPDRDGVAKQPALV